MATTQEQIAQYRAAIAAQEGLRGAVADEIVDAAIATLREKLAALEAPTHAEQQRKLATILFMDIAGHTAFVRDLDPEENMALIDAALARLAEPISRFGGHVTRYQGDGFKAVFGLPTAHEDDPENAVRAALAVQEVAAAIADEWTARGIAGVAPAAFRVRVGLDTGLVFAGGLTEGEDTVKGMPVNLAARLESAADPGTILISHHVYRHVRGVFDVQEREPVAVKGMVEPARTYVVQRAKPRTFRMATRGVEGIETRMVGREAEMLALQTTYFDALESAETRVVTVVGEAGVGKSRLLYEFENWLELRPERIVYFKGRSTPHTRKVTYDLFRTMFTFRFNILDSDEVAVALDKFRAGMAGALEPARADVVGHWLGFDFSAGEAVQRLLGSEGFADTARAHLMRYFRALASSGPVVFMLEDLHWADDHSLDLVGHLVRALSTERLLVVCAARPIFLEQRPGWGEGEAAFRRVHLTRLSRRASQMLVDEILQRVDQVPANLRDLIIGTAEGNPFYLEEMVKMLIDQGVIERDFVGAGFKPAPTGVVWRVRTEKLVGLRVPSTLTGLLQARLDGLPQPEREALQRASVVGRLFWDDVVAELMQTERNAITPTLEAVRERELIFRRERSSFVDAEEYIFKHALLRDVAYETVLLKHRAEFHGRVARWLEEHAGERTGEYHGLIAEHYVEAGEGLRAATLLEGAAHRALRAGRFLAARQGAERALELRKAAGQTDDPALLPALVTLSEACARLFEPVNVVSYSGQARELARTAGDIQAEASSLASLALAYRYLGELEAVPKLVAELLPLGQAAGGRAAMRALVVAAFAALDAKNTLEAETHANEAMSIAEQLGDLGDRLDVIHLLSIVSRVRGEPEKSRSYSQLLFDMSSQADHLFGQAHALVALGYDAFLREDYDSARKQYREVIDRYRELGLESYASFNQGNLAQAELKLGDTAAARQSLRSLLSSARRNSLVTDILFGVFVYGQVLVVEGQNEPALQLFGLLRGRDDFDFQLIPELERELAALNLTAEVIEAGLAAGASLDLETVVDEILDDQW